MQLRHLKELVSHRKPRLIRSNRQAAQQREVRGAAVVAHGQWRDECAAVRTAYHRWTGSPSAQRPDAFRAYVEALDREERAADHYARVIGSAGHIEEEPIALPAERRP